MTAVIGFSFNNQPILIGDLLLSGPEIIDRDVNIPSIGDPSLVFPKGSGYSITGVDQKLYLIDDNLAVGWAGRRITAKSVLSELQKKNRETAFELGSLVEYFKRIDSPALRQELCLAGFIKDRNGVAAVSYNSKVVSSSKFGRIMLLGTGSEDLLRQLEQILEQEVKVNRTLNFLEVAICLALQLSGVMLQHELISSESILNYYGGGYEIISLVGGRFVKIEDITSLYWAIEIKGTEITMSLPQLAFKFSYTNGSLIIRRAQLEPSIENNVVSFDDSAHLISSDLDNPKIKNLAGFSPPDFNSRYLCNYFLVKHAKRGIETLTRIDYTQNAAGPIRFVDSHSKLELYISKLFVDEIIESIKKRFSKSAIT